MPRTLEVIHIISGLDLGGAENMLRRLVESGGESISAVAVISLTSIGVVGEHLVERGVEVHALGMSSPADVPVTIWRVAQLIKRYQPAVVQTWMYHADLIGGIAALISGSYSIVWGVRSTSIPQGRLSYTYWLIRLCAILSYFIPDRIVCCAHSSKLAHIKLYYSQNKMIVIPNGYDFSVFRINNDARLSIRQHLGANEKDIVIGVVGRFDPTKDYFNFIVAAELLTSKIDNVRFLMVGRGNEWSNATLRGWIENTGLVDRFHLVGQRADVVSFYSAMDIFCLSSVYEAFPNVVVEAMAMGLPCVVTQVGDAPVILGDDDYVVPVKDSTTLANTLLKMTRLKPGDRKAIGDMNAQKVRIQYRIDTIKKMYAEVYSMIMK